MFGPVFAAYQALPIGRRREIGRHLATIMHGAEQDQLDAERREQIQVDRRGGDRGRRVPLFFEPEPEQPLLRPTPTPDIRTRHVAPGLVGALAVIVGTVRLVPAAPRLGTWIGAGALLLCVLGGAAAYRPLPLYVHLWRCRQAKARAAFGTDATPIAWPDERSAFAVRIDELIQERFVVRPPEVARERSRWFIKASSGVRDALRRDVIATYQTARDAVQADGLDWLIRWHAERTAHRWLAGILYDYTYRYRLSQREIWRLIAAVVALLAGVGLGVRGLWMAGDAGQRTCVVIDLGGLGLLVSVGLWIFSELRRVREQQAENEALHREEQAAYRSDEARLSERPDDAEMAAWLDYDKDHIRFEAMDHYQLGNVDVVGHVVLTEPTENCDQARVMGGPLRSSGYDVRMFLLTYNGVRQVDIRLDFATGALNKEERRTFRYDAIGHLRVQEARTRPYGRRQVATVAGGGPTTQPARPVLLQDFDLTLLNSQKIAFKVDYLTQFSQRPRASRESEEALSRLAQESSGVLTALRTLESVAAEGREWIRREQDRYRRSVAEYARYRRE